MPTSIGELETLIAAHPLRERLRGQLMLALYRSGRQAEALHVYRAARRELAEELGLEPGEALRRLEQAILQQDPGLELRGPRRPRRAPPETDRSLLVFPREAGALDALLRLAATLADAKPPRELILARVVAAADVGEAARALAERAEALHDEGIAARTAAFSSPTPGVDVARLAAQQDVDLLLTDAGDAPLAGDAGAVLEQAPCDVALLVDAGGPPTAGPVVVPFGGAHHDWAALELGTAVASATGAPLRLIGAASDDRGRGTRRQPPARRRVADRPAARAASWPSRCSPAPAARACSRSPPAPGCSSSASRTAGATRAWARSASSSRTAPPAPTVLVRRGAARPGLAPDDPRTRFRWSLTGAAP